MRAKLIGVAGLTLVVALIGLASVWAQEAWLVPSLGSAVFTQALDIEQPGARTLNVFASQALGGLAGFIAVLVLGASAAPTFMSGHPLALVRVASAALSALLAAAAMVATRTVSPAGGATAVIVALGLETTSAAGALRLFVGIALVTALGEAVRRLALSARPRAVREQAGPHP